MQRPGKLREQRGADGAPKSPVMSRRGLAAGVVAIGLVVLVVFALLRQEGSETGPATDASVALFENLTLPDDHGYAQARFPREFRFPADHGAHEDFRTESWYLTGTLRDERDRLLGLQIVLMRLGLDADPPERASRWGTSEIYAGLFSISDAADGPPHTRQRLSRAAVGLAGSQAEPVRLWVENWQLERSSPADDAPHLIARIRTDGIDLDLDLRRDTRQSPIDENAVRGETADADAPFHFYLQPRLHAAGTLHVGARQMQVEGVVALEHAWGELPLPGGPVAFDRFTLHLQDGRELFCLRRHRADGTGTATTTGLLIGADGRPIVLSRADIELEPVAYWTSGATGARYPIRWRLRVPGQAIDMELIPVREDQESRVGMPFWGGPVRLQAVSPAAPAGDGYVQLNGYHGT